MDNKKFSKALSLQQIRIKDSFWEKKIELVRKEVIPYQWEVLNDRIEEAEQSFCLRNFKLAAKIIKEKKEKGEDYEQKTYPTDVFQLLPKDKEKMEDRFYGYLFQDSDLYKWIEAVAYSLTQELNPELEEIADQAIDLACAAQEDNGYLNTYYIINNPDKIFTNLRDHHELYCFGHLVEAAVAYYQATGKDKLLKAAEKFANYISSRIGPEEYKLQGYPGHEIAEMALVRLYEITTKKRYLALSKFFVDERGKRPTYFDREHNIKAKEDDDYFRYFYHQAHRPVREQDQAVGHAVRAVYLYSGMADIARLTGDKELYQICEKLWNNITNKKMYITGGIGSTNIGEAFTFDYDLPNDTAYAESCASIGLVFFARRMLQMKPDSKYADVMERALYNGILSGMALDGKSFFYVNPLEVLPEASKKDLRKNHVKPIRQKWFGCACCPPNLARLISSIPSYAYTKTEDTLYVHLYMGSVIKDKLAKKELEIDIESRFPWDGKVSLEIKSDTDNLYTLALRIPDWCKKYNIDGATAKDMSIKSGYLYIKRKWSKGDRIELNFEMGVRLIEANPRLREDIGKIAVTRGPIVYCMEEKDNGKGLHLFILGDNTEIEESFVEEMGQEMVTITTGAKRIIVNNNDKQKLYREYSKASYEDNKIKWIPYYSWANRGEGEMQVWIRS